MSKHLLLCKLNKFNKKVQDEKTIYQNKFKLSKVNQK